MNKKSKSRLTFDYIQHVKSTNGATYFDELPIELRDIVKKWLTVNFESNTEPEEFECRRRDGFIPYNHNKGGMGIYKFKTLRDFQFEPCMIKLDKITAKAVEDAIEYDCKLTLESFKESHVEEVKGIPDNQLNYNDLYKIKKCDLAEELDSAAHDSLTDDYNSTYHQVRIMFDGFGTWTIAAMFSFKDAPYHRSYDQYKEWTIKTFGVKTLEKFLKKITKEVQLYFPN